MLLTVNLEQKSIGNKELFAGLQFTVEKDEKIAIIGRNGVGKTTLFRLLAGEDHEYQGSIQMQRGMRMVSTAQEHHGLGEQTVVEYVLHNLPEYARLKHILDTYPETMGEDYKMIVTYSNAVERFSSLDYYTIENNILQSLESYQINRDMAEAPMARLSGGQKRFVELVRIEHADADLALIDEPTNHMDYLAKSAFVDWFKAAKQTLLVITHDRDVLQHVDKVIEIKDGKSLTFKGNYAAYLKQNATSTTSKMHDYEIGLRTLENLHKQIQSVRAKKASTGKTPNPFIPLEKRLIKERDALEASLKKPSFWIDRESAENLGKKVSDNYQKYKDKNIRIKKNTTTESTQQLLSVEGLQLGYEATPLFQPVQMRLGHGDRMQLVGRNGAGKTTLIRAIAAAAKGERPSTWRAGSIFESNKLRLSIYEQEIGQELMDLSLMVAVERIYDDLGIPSTSQSIMQVMSDYLLTPSEYGALPVRQLSGGQKARLQIIKMLASNPNLLILDEPTNHLDLPSIEELENALAQYHGALLYVSHDSYFAEHVGGSVVTLTPVEA